MADRPITKDAVLLPLAAALIGFAAVLAFAASQPPTPAETCAADPVACVIILNRIAPPPPPGVLI